MYSGRIQGIGPRYCPESSSVREKNEHRIFVEPEGRDTQIYLNGISASHRRRSSRNGAKYPRTGKSRNYAVCLRRRIRFRTSY